MTGFFIPARPLLGCAGLWLALALPASVWPALLPAWQTAGVLAAVLAGADLLWAWRRPPRLRLARRLPHSVAVGREVELTLQLENHGPKLRFDLYDGLPASWECAQMPLRGLRLARDGQLTLGYRARPTQRGLQQIASVGLRVASPLGLWQRQRQWPLPDTLKVFPDYLGALRFELLAASRQLAQVGMHQQRRRGAGLEFHQLRPFQQGDSPRQVDWQASSRHGRLIAREYQDERDQHVLFLLDCGRRMQALDEGVAHFDRALAAMLLLDHVARKAGDAVGLATFACEQPRFVPPRRHGGGEGALMQHLFDLQPGPQAPDFQQAAAQLQARLNRRALVIVLSNLRDEDESALAPALRLLARRHLVVFASLREAALEQALQCTPDTVDDALRAGGAALYEAARVAAHQRLSIPGVRILDVSPEALPMQLVNVYHALKRAGSL